MAASSTTSSASSPPEGPPPRIAVFDLDGTITRHDTFWPYLRGWLRRHPARRRWWPALVALLRFALAGRDRGRLKADLMRAWMRDATHAQVDRWTAEFAAGPDAPALFPGATAAIARHRAAGDRLVLLSASVDLYVPALARRLGFDEVVCTEVRWRDGALDGSLAGPNLRAQEKRRCIEALRRRHPGAALTAYANSASDLPHLAAVDQPVLVNAGWRARQAARRAGMRIEDWRNNRGPGPV